MAKWQPMLDTPAKVARFVDIWNAASTPHDAARLLGVTYEQVQNMREWARRRKLPIKRFRKPKVGPAKIRRGSWGGTGWGDLD